MKKLIKVLIPFIVIGCASASPKLFVFENLNKKKKVVVLPFKNSTSNIVIGKIMYKILLCELANSKSFTPVEEGIVREFLIKNSLFEGEFPNLNQLKLLKSETHAEMVIGGEILQAGERGQDIKITLILWGRDIATGKLIWTSYYVKRGDDYRKILHFGKAFTLSELGIKMIKDIISRLENI